jgi:hypothetical protein
MSCLPASTAFSCSLAERKVAALGASRNHSSRSVHGTPGASRGYPFDVVGLVSLAKRCAKGTAPTRTRPTPQPAP